MPLPLADATAGMPVTLPSILQAIQAITGIISYHHANWAYSVREKEREFIYKAPAADVLAAAAARSPHITAFLRRLSNSKRLHGRRTHAVQQRVPVTAPLTAAAPPRGTQRHGYGMIPRSPRARVSDFI